MSLVFGIYPGGAAGGDSGLLYGPADDSTYVQACLDELRGSCGPFCRNLSVDRCGFR